jgi:hypothetical protein
MKEMSIPELSNEELPDQELSSNKLPIRIAKFSTAKQTDPKTCFLDAR